MNPHEAPDAVARSFQTKAPWKRVTVLLAGSLANYLVAVGVLTVLYFVGTHVPVPMTIGAVEPGSEAARALLRPGDRISTLDGQRVARWSSLVARVGDHPGEELALGVVREGVTRTAFVRPRRDSTGDGHLGLRQQYVYQRHPLRQSVGRAFAHTGNLMVEGARVLARLVQGKSGAEMADPTALFRQASNAASSGLDPFLRLFAGVSLALALFYLLPLPALDGGRALLVALQALTRRTLNPRLETFLHFVGFFALVALVLLVASNGVRQARRERYSPHPNDEAPASR